MPEMAEWTRRLGHSPADFNALNIIHVTGTKGKGSTCAFAQSILQQFHPHIARVGLYTSPHLKSVRERIRICGEPIDEERFTRYFFEVWDRLGDDSGAAGATSLPTTQPGMRPAYFKFLTLLSFYIFVREGVDTAIYEVGVGGQYDSTNIIQQPTATGVSALGIDHTFMLGSTIEEIAWNKAGIFKHGSRAFTVPQQFEAGMRVLRERAAERGVPLDVVSEQDVAGCVLGIPGAFQAQNAALAVALTKEHLRKLGVPYSWEKVKHGLAATHWPGRCQTIAQGAITWRIDGAHTTESVQASSGWFRSVAARSPHKKVLLFNQQTRDACELVRLLHDTVGLHFDQAVFSTNVTFSSGYTPDLVSMNTSKEQVDKLQVQNELAAKWSQLDPQSKTAVFHDIQSAVQHIRDEYANEQVEVFVCGSLHLVGGFLVVLESPCER